MNEEEKQKLHAYKMGYDAGRNGPNEINCNFRIFSKPEYTREWERGNEKGLAKRKSSKP